MSQATGESVPSSTSAATTSAHSVEELPPSSPSPTKTTLDRLREKFVRSIESLANAKPFAKSVYQTDVFQLAEKLMDSMEGLNILYENAHRFEEVGVFEGGPWAEAGKLQAPLVAGSLKATGVYPVVETLSELRMLAIAKSRASNETVSAKDATQFLNEVMALNLEFIFPSDSEEERIEGGPQRESNLRLFTLISTELDLTYLLDEVVQEIDQISAQRPIMTERVRRMIKMASRIPPDQWNLNTQEKLAVYRQAVSGPSALSKQHSLLFTYRSVLPRCDRATLEQEALAFSRSMAATGLVCPHHAVLIRHLRAFHPELIPIALGLNDVGAAELQQNRGFAFQLIKIAILPTTAQSIYGFARLLERGLLSRHEVTVGLRRLVDLDLQTDVRKDLLARRRKHDGVTANSILVAGMLSILGQPIGVGQGKNPTCQSARGISLWAQHAPGYLIGLVISGARDGFVEKPFEGNRINSSVLAPGLVRRFDMDMDPVSIVLVPHLDRIYVEMMRRVALHQEDGHKWVNPAFYGQWVPNGFASVFADVQQTTVANYEDFVRRFFATHHPAFNDGHAMMYPNPVGLCITNSRGDYLGPHAVSLLRIRDDPQGELRAFFFNPNNDGRQDWGHGVKPSISGHGEEEGESSLPFHDFVSRLYAFHYNPYEEGDAYAVPDQSIVEIEQAARNTWGKAFVWKDTKGIDASTP